VLYENKLGGGGGGKRGHKSVTEYLCKALGIDLQHLKNNKNKTRKYHGA
jgi:hypothetical protein